MASKIDRNNVTVSTDTEAMYWTVKLGAEEGAVRAAIEAVGTSPDAVAGWLRDHRLCRQRPGSAGQSASAPGAPGQGTQ